MKEKLFDRSEAVAALNRVEGFNPMELASTLTKEGQEDQLSARAFWDRFLLNRSSFTASPNNFLAIICITSYYIVVVFIVPLQGLYAILPKILWIVFITYHSDGLSEATTTASLYTC